MYLTGMKKLYYVVDIYGTFHAVHFEKNCRMNIPGAYLFLKKIKVGWFLFQIERVFLMIK